MSCVLPTRPLYLYFVYVNGGFVERFNRLTSFQSHVVFQAVCHYLTRCSKVHIGRRFWNHGLYWRFEHWGYSITVHRRHWRHWQYVYCTAVYGAAELLYCSTVYWAAESSGQTNFCCACHQCQFNKLSTFKSSARLGLHTSAVVHIRSTLVFSGIIRAMPPRVSHFAPSHWQVA